MEYKRINPIRILEVSNYKVVLKCNSCHNEIEGKDPDTLLEMARWEGWDYDMEIVLCPVCREKVSKLIEEDST